MRTLDTSVVDAIDAVIDALEHFRQSAFCQRMRELGQS